jgi:hypothetical protein
MASGVEVTPNDVNEIEPGTESFTGYSIVNAETLEAAVGAGEDESDDHQRRRLRVGPHAALPARSRWLPRGQRCWAGRRAKEMRTALSRHGPKSNESG